MSVHCPLFLPVGVVTSPFGFCQSDGQNTTSREGDNFLVCIRHFVFPFLDLPSVHFLGMLFDFSQFTGSLILNIGILILSYINPISSPCLLFIVSFSI